MIYVLTWERYHKSGTIVGAWVELLRAVERMREVGVKADEGDCTAMLTITAIDDMGKPLPRTLILTPPNQYYQRYHPDRLVGKVIENLDDREPVDPYTFDFRGS